jgi:hypothetical protein
MTQPNAPAQPLDALPFAVLIDEAWRSTRAWARAILVPAAAVLAPGALALQVLIGLWNLSIVSMEPGRFEPSRFCGTMAVGMVAVLLVAIFYAAVYGCVMVTVVRVLGGEAPRLRSSARFYLQPKVWATDLLAWVLTALGFAACILPGLFLLAAWALRVPVMVREGRFGWDALARSWELLFHNPSGRLLRHPLLKVLLIFVLGAVLGYAVSMLVQMPAVVVNQAMMMRAMTRGQAVDPQAIVRATLWLSIPAGVVAALAQLVVQLYIDFVTGAIYFDQVRRKEGTDLSAALDQLTGGGPAPGGPTAVPG